MHNFKNLRSILKFDKDSTVYDNLDPAKDDQMEKLAKNKPKRLKEHSNFLKGINRSPAQQEIDGNEKKRRDNG